MLWNILLSLILAIAANVVLAYVAVLVHECGHAIAGRMAGFYVTSFGAGTGRPLLTLRLPGGTIFYIGREHPWQGLTWVTSPYLIPPRLRTAVLLLGGPLANLLLAGVYYFALPQIAPRHWLLPVVIGQMAGNVILGFGNLLPLSISLGKTILRSDGAQTLALFPRRGTVRPLQSPEAYLGLRSLWDSIGDTTQLYANLVTAALTACDLKDFPQARRLLEEARRCSFPEHLLPLHRTYAMMVEGILLQEEGDSDRGVQLIEQAEREFAAKGNELMRLVTVATREDREALPLVTALSDHPLLERLPAFRASIASAHLLLAVRYDAGNIETLLARYESARSWYRYLPSDWQVYTAIAQYRETHGDVGGAAIAYEQAARAARSIFEALENDSATQEAFTERVQPLVADGAQCLESLGRHDDAALFRALIPSAETIQVWRENARQQAESREQDKTQKERNVFKTGLWLLGVDLILIAAVTAIYFNVLPEDETTFKLLRLLFLTRTSSVVFCLITLLCLSGRWLLTRKPLSAGNTGRYLLYAVGLFWVMFLVRIRETLSP